MEAKWDNSRETIWWMGNSKNNGILAIDPFGSLYLWVTLSLITACKSKNQIHRIAKETNHIFAAAAAKSFQLCLTLCNPIDGSLPGSPVPGILQARTLEGVPPKT